MSDDKLYIRAVKEARWAPGTDRDEVLWAEAWSVADGNEVEAGNRYVNLRVAQLRRSIGESREPLGDRAPVSSVENHPDFISVAKYSARNHVDDRL